MERNTNGFCKWPFAKPFSCVLRALHSVIDLTKRHVIFLSEKKNDVKQEEGRRDDDQRYLRLENDKDTMKWLIYMHHNIHAASLQRLPFTLGFVGSMVGTIYVSMVLHSYILSVLFSVLQVIVFSFSLMFFKCKKKCAHCSEFKVFVPSCSNYVLYFVPCSFMSSL